MGTTKNITSTTSVYFKAIRLSAVISHILYYIINTVTIIFKPLARDLPVQTPKFWIAKITS